MDGRGPFGLPPDLFRRATLAGIVVGIVYTLSPLTVWFALGVVPVAYYATQGLDPDERRWVTGLLVLAVALRLVAVAALFVFTDHAQVPFGSFFGDEEYFIERSLWLRNAGLGMELHRDDLVSAFDPVGASGYLYLLALIQILAGPSPYGVHLVGVLFYLTASVLLYRLVRSTLGHMPAFIGLTVLLFLPSLLAWSVSALKEPLFMLLNAAGLVAAVNLVRGPWKIRWACLAAMVALGVGLESLRPGSAALSAVGMTAGLVIGFLVRRPRLLLAAVITLPVLTGAVLSRPEVQLTAFSGIRAAASQHWAYVVLTPGYRFKLLDERFYHGPADIPELKAGEALRFIARAVAAYVTAPLPWKVESPAALAYLPEQVCWYLLVALAAVGLLFAFRRDATVAALLLAHAVVIAAVVALTSGNVGALVRHRGLALPYVVWLSALGGCELMARRAVVR